MVKPKKSPAIWQKSICHKVKPGTSQGWPVDPIHRLHPNTQTHSLCLWCVGWRCGWSRLTAENLETSPRCCPPPLFSPLYPESDSGSMLITTYTLGPQIWATTGRWAAWASSQESGLRWLRCPGERSVLGPGGPWGREWNWLGGMPPSPHPAPAPDSIRPQGKGRPLSHWRASADCNWTWTCPVIWANGGGHVRTLSLLFYENFQKRLCFAPWPANQEDLLFLYRKRFRPLTQISIKCLLQKINHDSEEGAGEGEALGAYTGK